MSFIVAHQADPDRVAFPMYGSNSPTLRYENVLVPLDGTTNALAALPTARALAVRFGATLHTINVTPSRTEVATFRKDGSVAAVSQMPGANAAAPADAIARQAMGLGSCLVCMSTASRGRFIGSIRGSVTRSVLSHVGPVVAVGPVADRPTWPARNGSRRSPAPLSNRSLVACVDGSTASEAVLPVASAWARALDMSLTILMFTPGSNESKFSPADYVQGLASRWSEAAPDVTALAIPEPIGVAGGVRAYLDRHPAGLVAVSTQARSGLQRMLHGAATDKILRASPVPCLVVPQSFSPLRAAKNE